MAEPFSTIASFKLHWAALPEDRVAEATKKLREASIKVRTQFPDVDARIAAGTLDPEVPELVVNEMVKRAMDTPQGADLAGVAQATGQTGPFATTFQFTNPDGNLYLSRDDRRMLAAGRPGKSGKAFSIHPGGLGAQST